MPSAANGRPARLLYKVGCSLLAATLAFSSVPTAAIARSGEAADSEEGLVQRDGVEGTTASYHPDFGLDDIALPEGCRFDDDGNIVYDGDAKDDAPTLVSVAPKLICLAKDKEDSAKAAQKEYDEQYKYWKRAAKTVGFAVDGLHTVNKTAGLVGDYGQALFDMIKGCALGDFCEMFYGGANLLALMGAFPTGGDDDDLTKGIKDLNAITAVMRDELNKVSRQEDILQLQPFDHALDALGDDCFKVEKMLSNARVLAAQRGLKKPAEPVEPKPTPAPKLPAEPAKPELPTEPAEPKLPAEPAEPEFPAEPQLELPPEPLSPDNFFWGSASDDSDARWKEQLAEWKWRYGIVPEATKRSMNQQYAESLYEQAHAAWEEEASSVKARHEQDVAGWQAECDHLKAEYDKAHADWEAERDRLKAEYDKAHADWKAERDRLKAEYDKAHADWKAECDRLRAEAEKNDRAVAEWKDGTAKVKYGEQCTEYVRQLIKISKEREKIDRETAGKFDGFTAAVERIETNFNLVAGECMKKGEWSPFNAYDDYWEKYFNWETQGYYLRKAYRVNAVYWLRRSYAIIAAYRDLMTPDALEDAFKPKNSQDEEDDETLHNPFVGFTSKLASALISIEESPAGISPESINPSGEYSVRCYVNGKTATGSNVGFNCEGEAFSDDQIAQYKQRLHNRSAEDDLVTAVKDDLVTAGLYNPIVDTYGKDGDQNKKPVAGIYMRGRKVDGGVLSEVQYWEATLLEWGGDEKTCETCQLWNLNKLEPIERHNLPQTAQPLNCSYLYFNFK